MGFGVCSVASIIEEALLEGVVGMTLAATEEAASLGSLKGLKLSSDFRLFRMDLGGLLSTTVDSMEIEEAAAPFLLSAVKSSSSSSVLPAG